jgi:hypothetical protein
MSKPLHVSRCPSRGQKYNKNEILKIYPLKYFPINPCIPMEF